MALNIMMDPSKLYPQSYHPRRIDKSCDFNGTAKHMTRTKQPPKYYFIDFGLSGRYNPENGPPLEYPIRGGDKTVPEFRDLERPCNPFPTDIYYIGNMIRQDFLQVRTRPLIFDDIMFTYCLVDSCLLSADSGLTS
jgi:hypothetical protein